MNKKIEKLIYGSILFTTLFMTAVTITYMETKLTVREQDKAMILRYQILADNADVATVLDAELKYRKAMGIRQ